MRYYRHPIMTSLADKYAVRDYVADKIGHEFLNELECGMILQSFRSTRFLSRSC
jgi:hypothetical protein